MSAYADASLIVSAYTMEQASEQARRWLSSLGSEELLTSDWCATEVASALAMKERTGQLSRSLRQRTREAMIDLFHHAATTLPVSSRHFAGATRLLERSVLPLRGGDALHLAIAADAGATLWTLDRRMAEAGQALGLDVRLLA